MWPVLLCGSRESPSQSLRPPRCLNHLHSHPQIVIELGAWNGSLPGNIGQCFWTAKVCRSKSTTRTVQSNRYISYVHGVSSFCCWNQNLASPKMSVNPSVALFCPGHRQLSGVSWQVWLQSNKPHHFDDCGSYQLHWLWHGPHERFEINCMALTSVSCLMKHFFIYSL